MFGCFILEGIFFSSYKAPQRIEISQAKSHPCELLTWGKKSKKLRFISRLKDVFPLHINTVYCCHFFPTSPPPQRFPSKCLECPNSSLKGTKGFLWKVSYFPPDFSLEDKTQGDKIIVPQKASCMAPPAAPTLWEATRGGGAHGGVSFGGFLKQQPPLKAPPP